MTAANAPTVRPLHVTLTRPDGTSAAPPTVIVMALDAKELPLTVIPLGDVMPQALAVLAVTNPLGNVNVIFPLLAGRTDAVVKDNVHVCSDPWPRRPVRTGLETQFVQGVLT